MNINDADISPESKDMPVERDGLTDMSLSRIHAGTCEIVRQLVGPGARDAAMEDQSSLLNEIYQKYEQGYLRYTNGSGNIAYWVSVIVARLVMAKMTLIVFLPVLFSSPNERLSDELRAKLLVSAIEVAEYNHALNAEHACREWRWVYQTYTHWHAIVYLMIDIARRPWSPIVERAWVALHSRWLIPAQTTMDKSLRIWVPLRKLMAKARKHRDAELNRLRADPQAATRLEMEDQKIPVPSSSGPFPTGSSVDIFRERWRLLVAMPKGPENGTQKSGVSGVGLADPLMLTTYTSQPTVKSISTHIPGDLSSNITFEPTYLDTSGQQAGQNLESTNVRNPGLATLTNNPSEIALGQTVEPLYHPFPAVPVDWSDSRTTGFGFGSVPWLWADADPSADMFSKVDVDNTNAHMDLDDEVNWYDWVESAKSMA